MGNTNANQHTTPKRRREPTCDSCGGDIVEIELLLDGQPLAMRSCSACDTRSWHRHGTPADLDEILTDVSSVPKRYRRDLSTSR